MYDRSIKLIAFYSVMIVTLLITLIGNRSHALASGVFTVCHEETSYPPYIYTSKGIASGLLVDIISQSAKLSSIKLNLYSSSWLRCQKDVQSGRADALFAMVKTPEREQRYQFPTTQPDLYFLWQAQYPVFYEIGIGFDAKNYIPNKGLAAPLGYVVTEKLKNKNWLSPYTYKPNEGLAMVAIKKLDGYVVERLIGTELLKQLELSSKVKASDTSLLNTNWYIPFNRKFYKANKHMVELFWRNIATVREKQHVLSSQ